MEDDLKNSLLTICRLLEKFKVQYMLVGGTAVALNGYYRHSINTAGELTDKPDIDIWYNPTYENYFNLLNAFEGLGQNVTEFKQEQAPNPKKSFFKFEFDNFTADFLPELKALLKFSACFEKKEVVTLFETDIPFIGYNDLIEDKKANSRPKDISDIEELKNFREQND